MTMSEKSTSESPNKQKTIAIVVFLIFVVIIWQVIGLLKGSSTQPVTPPTVAATGGAMAAKSDVSPTSSPPQSQTEMNIVPVPREAELYKLQQEAQQKYISSLNELQTLRIQKEIAETNQAITAAKLATVSAEKNITELLTKPATPTLPPSAYAPASGQQFSSSSPVATQEVVSPVVSNDSEAQYVLISVSMQLNKWNAVIGYRGKPYQVSVGTVLPPDSSEVISISNSAVVLERGGRKRKITLVPPI